MKQTTIKREEMGITHISQLAEKIASLPQNHDELEILIADLIKKYVHQEKLSVYSRLKLYVEDILTSPPEWQEKHMKSIFDMKIETHKELAKKWEYGTDYSCATHIMREYRSDYEPDTSV